MREVPVVIATNRKKVRKRCIVVENKSDSEIK